MPCERSVGMLNSGLFTDVGLVSREARAAALLRCYYVCTYVCMYVCVFVLYMQDDSSKYIRLLEELIFIIATTILLFELALLWTAGESGWRFRQGVVVLDNELRTAFYSMPDIRHWDIFHHYRRDSRFTL